MKAIEIMFKEGAEAQKNIIKTLLIKEKPSSKRDMLRIKYKKLNLV